MTPYLLEIANENLFTIKEWINANHWLFFAAKQENSLSSSTIVFAITEKRRFNQKIAILMESNEIAFDVLNHSFSPPSFRVWGGATIDKKDLEILTKWFEWAYHITLRELKWGVN